MTNTIGIRIIAEITGQDDVKTYELGAGVLDLMGLTSSTQAMHQVPNVLRDLADQFDEQLNSGCVQ